MPYSLTLVVFGSFHGLQLGHVVWQLSGTGDQGLDIVFDGGLVQIVNLVKGFKNNSLVINSS